MINLSEKQLQDKIDFINHYIHSKNAADGSKVDANANVSHKNIATLEAEISKDMNIEINRRLLYNKIKEIYDEDLAKEYIRQIEEKEIYQNDSSSLKPYCVSITMYPLLLDGLVKLGGESKAPLHISSFCGSFINLIFAISAQFAGAVAAVEFLMYFDYFARKDYGNDYINTHKEEIKSHLQHIIYSLNQPAAARGFQSCFFNISIYDEFYFKSMFGDFVFPDGGKPEWDSLKELQKFFMNWFNKERTKALLTFPVITAAMLSENGKPKDEEFTDFISKEFAEGNSFFIYSSENADALSSCCRLTSKIEDNTFSYSLGAGGVATGSLNVITLNLNRIAQRGLDLREQVKKVQKYQVAYRKIMEELKDAGMLSVYDAGFISMQKQYLTIGINGFVESAEAQGITVGNNQRYKDFIKDALSIINEENKLIRKETGYMFNTEMIPAENLGVKNAKWDKEDGLFVPRDVYNSYFYIVEDEDINTIDKFILHGSETMKYLDGGSALHLNLENYLSPEGYKSLITLATKTGCNYFTTNVKITLCRDCGYIDKRTLHSCSKCGSEEIDWATRIIGYLKCIKSFSSARQKEEGLRFYHNDKKELPEIESSLIEQIYSPLINYHNDNYLKEIDNSEFIKNIEEDTEGKILSGYQEELQLQIVG